MMTAQGKVIQIPVESVRSVNRVAMGVKMLNLDAGDAVTAVTKVVNGAVKELKDDESGDS
jgi:DNA gyrase/topoisomerase IV subunit A